jgi:hypothetical protein
MVIRKSNFLSLALITLAIILAFNFAEVRVVKPKARGTKSGGQTIDQTQREDEIGPKARVARVTTL